MKRIICFCTCFLSLFGSSLFAQKLKEFELKPTPVNTTQKFYVQDAKKAFYVQQLGCVVGQMSMNIGIADMIDKGKYYEVKFKSIEESHAVKSYDYKTIEGSTDLTVIVIDIDGDTLPMDSITLGKANDYVLDSRKGIDAVNGYNTFPMSPKNKLTHFTLPGFYKLFGHDVIFGLPYEEFNAITIRLNIPNEFYIYDEGIYKSVGVDESAVYKMVYTDEKISEFKSGEDDPAYVRDYDAEQNKWETKLFKKPLKKKK